MVLQSEEAEELVRWLLAHYPEMAFEIATAMQVDAWENGDLGRAAVWDAVLDLLAKRPNL